MKEADMFHLLWGKFIKTGVLQENGDQTHKVLFQRVDGWWALKYAEGMVIQSKPTMEELMLAVIEQKEGKS